MATFFFFKGRKYPIFSGRVPKLSTGELEAIEADVEVDPFPEVTYDAIPISSLEEIEREVEGQ